MNGVVNASPFGDSATTPRTLKKRKVEDITIEGRNAAHRTVSIGTKHARPIGM